jgi:hypothetical protein
VIYRSLLDSRVASTPSTEQVTLVSRSGADVIPCKFGRPWADRRASSVRRPAGSFVQVPYSLCVRRRKGTVRGAGRLRSGVRSFVYRSHGQGKPQLCFCHGRKFGCPDHRSRQGDQNLLIRSAQACAQFGLLIFVAARPNLSFFRSKSGVSVVIV